MPSVMVNGMRATIVKIDKAGRLVLPKALRDRFRLRPGSQLDVRTAEDHFELHPVGFEAPIVNVDGWWVHQGVPESDEDLLEAVARHRDDRHGDLSK
jgi:AbrB family looped-hinge helix DNA binding protein